MGHHLKKPEYRYDWVISTESTLAFHLHHRKILVISGISFRFRPDKRALSSSASYKLLASLESQCREDSKAVDMEVALGIKRWISCFAQSKTVPRSTLLHSTEPPINLWRDVTTSVCPEATLGSRNSLLTFISALRTFLTGCDQCRYTHTR